MSRFSVMADSMVNIQALADMPKYPRATQYFVHINRLVTNKSDGSINEELGRRFILEEVDVDSEKLNISDLDKASQDDIKSLTNVFDSWLRSAVSDGENNDEFNVQHSARFHDFLVVDEGSLRSLAALPKETPPLGLGVKQFQGGESDGGDYGHNYDGCEAVYGGHPGGVV
ncbi:hypothetical protein ACLOAV_004216 [Pseudogymnoascus australis]